MDTKIRATCGHEGSRLCWSAIVDQQCINLILRLQSMSDLYGVSRYLNLISRYQALDLSNLGQEILEISSFYHYNRNSKGNDLSGELTKKHIIPIKSLY